MRLKLHHQIIIAMVIGAGIGLPLNFLARPTLQFTIDPALVTDLQKETITPALRDALAGHALNLSDDAVLSTIVEDRRWRIEDRGWRYAVRLVDDKLGVYFGNIPQAWPDTLATYGKGVGDVFLRLLSMIVAPLILSSLISGVTSNGSTKGLGRLGGLTIGFYMTSSLIAVLTGMIVFNIFQPGAGSNFDAILEGAGKIETQFIVEEQTLGQTLWSQVFNLIPANPFAALADPGNRSILGVIFFAILFGIFINLVGGEAGALLTRFFRSFFEVMMRMTMFIILFAPIGVLGFMLYASAGKGLEVFVALGWYALTVAVGLTFHGMVTMPLIILLLARRSPWEYFKAILPALLTAFSTASSNGTLPLTLTCVEERAGISNRYSSFVLPLGATINMDGTALYEAVAVLFIAQVTGYDLSLTQQAVVAFMALMVSVGAAGIPHAGTVMMVVILSAVGLPIEYVGLILAVDRVLDMYRTTINIWSDTVCCAVVARLAGDQPAGATPATEPARSA